MTTMHARVLMFAVLLCTGCRLNPDCFGQNECGRDLVCSQGECVHPTLLVAEAGVDDDAGVQSETWCEVQSIVQTRCMPCHADPPEPGVPISLVTYADTQRRGTGNALVYALMAERTSSQDAPMPPSGEPPATQIEIDTIASWAFAGAPNCATPIRDAGVMAERDGGVEPGRDGGPPRDAGPERDGGPGRDGGPFNPLTYLTNVREIGMNMPWANAAGTIWLPDDGVQLFADPGRNLVTEAEPPQHNFAPFRTGSDGTNGMTVDPDGNLVITEITGRRIARREGNNFVTIMDTYEGARLNSPNDVIFRSDGVMYFTDPPYGLARPSDREIPFNGVYSFVPTATTAALVAEYEGDPFNEFPSGLALSPDEMTLYQTDVQTGDVVAWDVLATGRLANRRIFASATPPIDGVACDAWGNVYLGASEGLLLFEPDGTEIGRMTELPTGVNRMAFGGANRRTLYVTAGDSVYAVSAAVAGIR